MADRIQFRRDSADNWNTFNPVLANGEIGIELDTQRFKLGDGVTAWSSLVFATSTIRDNIRNFIGNLGVDNISYNGDGTVSSITYEGEYKVEYTYNSDSTLNTELYRLPDSSVLVTYTMNYDTDGNLVSIAKS